VYDEDHAGTPDRSVRSQALLLATNVAALTSPPTGLSDLDPAWPIGVTSKLGA